VCAKIQPAGIVGQRTLTDEAGPEPRQRTFVFVRESLVEYLSDHEIEKCIAEKFEPLVRL
jgi:hypothetical protein